MAYLSLFIAKVLSKMVPGRGLGCSQIAQDKNRLASSLKSREKSAKDLTGASSVEIQSAAAELPSPMQAR
jgi:hypothetical protein